jgi:hypothetical protein
MVFVTLFLDLFFTETILFPLHLLNLIFVSPPSLSISKWVAVAQEEDLPLALVLLLHAAQLLNLYTVHLLQLQLRPAVVVVACSQALVQPLLRVWLLVLEVQLHTGLLIL